MNTRDTRLFLKSLGLALIHAAEEIELPDDPASTATPSDRPFDLPASMQTQPPMAQPPTNQPPVAQPPGQVQVPAVQPPTVQPPTAQPPVAQPSMSPPPSAQPPKQAQPPETQLESIDDTVAAQAFCQELNRLNRECGGMMEVFTALFAQYLPEGGGCSKVKPEHRDAFLARATEAAREVALSRGISM